MANILRLSAEAGEGQAHRVKADALEPEFDGSGFVLVEHQAGAIHAIAQTGWWWTVWKDMALMGIADGAADFHAVTMREIIDFKNSFRADRLIEAWPA